MNLMQCDLISRGWTKRLIDRVLGEPDEVRRTWPYHGRVHLFGSSRVKRAENRQDIKMLLEGVRAKRISRDFTKDYLAEITNSQGDELHHWSKHPVIEAHQKAVLQANHHQNQENWREQRATRRIAALERQAIDEYLNEVCDPSSDETKHWSDQPVVAPFMAEAQKHRQRELLARHGILPSLFAVNREAKRQREESQRAWRDGDDCMVFKGRKEELYWLKGQALEFLCREGTLERAGYHEFPGGCVAEVLAGAGYRFHRPVPKAPDGVPVLKLHQIESKPVQAGEVPAEEAEAAVRGFLQNRSTIPVYQWPTRERKAEWTHNDEVGFV